MNTSLLLPHRRLGLVLIVLLLATVACTFPGCGAQQEPAEPEAQASPTVDVSQLPPTAPQVVARQPEAGEELPLDGSVDVYFDQPMDQASVESALSTDPALDGEVTWIDDSTLRFTPAAGELQRATNYTLTIGEAALAANGLALEAPVAIELQTVGFLQVGEVVPAPGADAVEPASVITVMFNRPVVPLTIAEDMGDLPQPLSIEPEVPGEGEWLNTSIYMWRPDDPLPGGQTYTVTVAGGLEDQTGGVMQDAYSWEFTTLPPNVTSVQPTDENVPLDAPLVVEFNQQMDRASVEAALTLVDADGEPVSGSAEWSEDGRTLTFQPDDLLALGGVYTAIIDADARGAGSQTALNGNVSWEFHTVLAPDVLYTTPADGEQDASHWAGINIFFTAPIDEDTLDEDLLVVEPALPDEATYYYNSFDNSWNINATLEPSTSYTVTLRAGAADPYGNTIDRATTWRFTTEPLPPSVQLNTQGQAGLYDASRTTELFALYRNVSQVDFQLAKLDPPTYVFLNGPGGYEALRDFAPDQDQLLREWSIPSKGALNEGTYVRVPVVSEEGGSLEPGLYLLTADAPELDLPVRHFMIVTSANLTFKSSFTESMVWLTGLESGQPIAGAPVTLYDDEFNPIGSGTTDADGVVEIGHSERQNLWDLSYAIVDDGDMFAMALNQWDEQIQPWQFGSIPTLYSAEDFSLYLYTDRPLYRPGQEVFFKGILRNKDDVTYTLPGQVSVHVAVMNDQGDTIYEDDLPLDAFGAFDGTITLDDSASLGYYNIQVTLGDLSYGMGFQVAEYRVPEFLVNVTPAADQVLAGEDVEVTVGAEFYFGGPVSDAPVTWTVLAEDYYFAPDVPGRYSFTDTDQDQRYNPDYVPGFGEVIADGEGTTDANGEFVIRVPASLEDSDTSQRFTVEATVTDVNDQPVSGRTEVIVHKGQVYVGVSPDVYVGQAGQPISASLLAVDWNGKPVKSAEVEVEFVQQRWNSVQEEDEFGRTQWTWTVEEMVVGDPVTVTTDGSGEATVEFTPPEGGTFKIRATVTDDEGNAQSGSAFVWVSGDAFVAWRQANNDRIDLVADKDSYVPGDTAEILIASPFQGAVQALVTIERGSILSHEVIELSGNSTVYEVPITGDLAPNVYVSVVIVKGEDDSNPTPAFKMGLVELAIEPIEQTIDVTLTPDRDTVGPREEVTYTVETTDSDGNPVDAEVSLALVDLATLSLAAPNSGSIVDHFYGNAGLGVRTSVPLSILVDRLNQELFDQGKGGGGGGGEGFFDVRTEFEDTAFWTADLQTGEDGQATVAITLPDNLTTWRMDARAVTEDTRVGQQQVDITATKPLLIRPNTQRFFVVGDEATVSAVVNNNTDDDIDAQASLEVDGLTLVGDAVQEVSVPAGGRVEVAWQVSLEALTDSVDLVFGVEGGGLSDSARSRFGDPDDDYRLPVYRYDVPETVGTAGQLTEAGARTEGVVLPPTYDVQQGSVDVRIDPSLASATLDGLTWLRHYPYECTEQTVSRFLPNALTLRTLREMGVADDELEGNLESQVLVGLQRLYAQQHVDGGWGWFVDGESQPTVTAYVVQGMIAARGAGFQVEQRAIDDAVGYLATQLEALETISAQYQLHTQSYVLYVLALAGEPDVSRTVQLYDAREGMQHWARALLAQTLALIDPTDDRLASLESDLTSSAIVSATGVHWEEETDDVWNWNTDTRSTAIILDTYARLWPDSDLAPNMVRWLMVAREGSHWETTQETAWALIGLTDWMTASGELDADYDWTFAFNGSQRAEGHAGPQTLRDSTQLSIDVAELMRDEVNRLTFERTAGDGRLYYTAHLNAYLPVEEVDPLSRGVIVSRRYLDEDGNRVTSGAVGDVLTVEVTVVAPNDLYYLVVEDPYPAGAEPVDTSLLTESVLGERPQLQPDDPLAKGWGWWWFSQTDLRDEKAVLYADHLPAGTYQYTYQIRLGLPGEYRVIPTTAREFYLPEVYGRGEGSVFSVEE